MWKLVWGHPTWLVWPKNGLRMCQILSKWPKQTIFQVLLLYYFSRVSPSYSASFPSVGFFLVGPWWPVLEKLSQILFLFSNFPKLKKKINFLKLSQTLEWDNIQFTDSIILVHCASGNVLNISIAQFAQHNLAQHKLFRKSSRTFV